MWHRRIVMFLAGGTMLLCGAIKDTSLAQGGQPCAPLLTAPHGHMCHRPTAYMLQHRANT